ncbi:hypothetical protein BaRGS_00026773, partial [Batillaria attramentaria]
MMMWQQTPNPNSSDPQRITPSLHPPIHMSRYPPRLSRNTTRSSRQPRLFLSYKPCYELSCFI